MIVIMLAAFICLASSSAYEENRKLRHVNKALLKALETLNAETQVGASFSTGVAFYEGKNYQGHDHKYEESYLIVQIPDHVSAGGFNSVKVGHFSKVFVWNTRDHTPVQASEFNEDNHDIGGIHNFKVTSKETQGVYVRLVDGINTGKLYCMRPKVYGEGEGADVNSCTDNEDYQLLGTLKPGDDIVTQVPVRNMDHYSMNFGQYISNGSLYFTIDANGAVKVKKEHGSFDNFPQNLSISKVGDNKFEITIIDEEPDV